MQDKKNIIKQKSIFKREFVKIIFLLREFFTYFYTEYLELMRDASDNKFFFGHTWILILIKECELKTITEIMMATKANQSTLSRAVNSLIRAGYLQKKRDGKEFLLSLTEKGEALFHHIKKVFDQENKNFKTKVPQEDIDVLLKILKKVNGLLAVAKKKEEGDK